ncbi:MAG: T9SS type A sorting domain-containing protein [Saprospiraceae bacterium]
MNHKNRLIILSVLVVFLQFTFSKAFGEGTKQLSPTAQDSAMLHTNASGFGDFASYTSFGTTSALKVSIASLTDTLFIGLSAEADDFGTLFSSYQFRILDPTGAVAFGPFTIGLSNDNDTTWIQNIIGPGAPGGYSVNPILYPYSRFVPTMIGDYTLQFDDGSPGNIVNILWYDFTVRNAGIVKPGRLWSRNWALRTPPRHPGTPPECQFDRPFNGVFFSYTTDSFVSKIDFNNSGFQGLSFNVSFGDRGPGNSGNVIADRRSVKGINATANNADYMAFLSEPDPILYPSSLSQCGSVSLLSVSCVAAGSYCINVGVTKPGQVEVILDFNNNGLFDPNTQDVLLAMIYPVPDTACIPWNGLKGDGSQIAFGEQVPAIIRYSQGVQHYAAFDVEFLKNGFCVQTIRPICSGMPNNLLYWDDSQITDDVVTMSINEGDPGTGQPKMQLNGCVCHVAGCRSWNNFQIGDPPTGTCTGPTYGYGDNNTLNTWWYASVFVIDSIFLPFAQVSISGDSVICAGDSTVFFANVSPPTTMFNFMWSGPGGFTANTQSTGFVQLAGVYTVTITDPISNCSAIDSIHLIITQAPTTTISFTCLGANQSNANVNLTVSGGSPPYTYIWSNGATTEDLFNVPPGTYTVTVTDANGCKATNSITVQGCCTLSVTCPPSNGGTFQCASNVPPASPSAVTVNSFCNSFNVTNTQTNNGGTGCPASPLVITRTYNIVDGAGNSATCTQTFTVIDNMASISCPANITVQCANLVPAPNPASVTTSDNCGGGTTVTFVGDVTSNQTCANRFTVTRTYRSTDGCGNSATCNQTISVFDNTPPSISCPANITVECAGLVPLSNIASVAATDNCGGGATVTFVADVIASQTCTNRFNVIRTYRATDACGNSATCSQTIAVFDSTPPSISCPSNVTVQCANLIPAPNIAVVISSDNCIGASTVSFVNDVTVNQTCTNRFNVIRTYRATDACGNSATCSQTIFVFDNTPPALTCPANTSVQCASLIPAPNPAAVTSSDNCNGVASVTFVSDVTTNQTCINRFNVIRTYRATDECGNSATCSQTITVFDNTVPTITCPTNITVQCASQVPAPNTASIVTTDNCGGAASVTFQNDVIANQICTNRFNVIRTYVATDACGNSATCSQTIVVFDNTPPSITCPVNVTVQCASLLPAPNTAAVSSSDNCNGAATVTFVNDVVANQTCVNRFNVIRTYRATDECGNSATCSQTITVFDNTPPSITCPMNVTVQCASLVPAPTPAAVISTDNCGGQASTAFVSDVTVNQTCTNRFTVNRTYSSTDACGNSATCTQTITVFDNTPPAITCPVNVTVQCVGLVPAPAPGSVVTSDNCGGAATVTSVDNITNQTCASRFTLTRTYFTTDVCGNSASCNQTITVFDNTLPTLTCPSNVTVTCASAIPAPNPASVTSSDNCGTPTITFVSDVISNQTCTNKFTVTRTYRATDVCGNSATCSQIIIVNDNVPPTAICQNFMINFGSSTTVTISPNDINNGSFDNCGGPVTLSLNDTSFDCSEFNGTASLPVILTVTDACGNSSTCQALVSGVGGALTIDCPDNITVNLGPGECVAYVNYVVTAEALCGGSNVQIIQVDTSGLTSGSPFPIGVTTQTYIATNGIDTVTCSFTITVIEYDIPVVLACNDTINVSVTQNCDAHIFVDMVLVGTSYGCFNDYIISIMNVGSDTGWIVVSGVPVNTFYMVTITDPETGNSCWGKIHLEDKIPPQIICACPPNSVGGDTCVISCLEVDQLANGIIPPNLYPQVIENCEYVLTIQDIDVNNTNCGNGSVTVTWKVTDESNLMATCAQVFRIEPLSADSLIFPPNYIGACGTSSDPNVTGWPTIHGINLTDDVNLCNLFLGFWDQTIQDCGGGVKILRKWLVLDWCTLELVEGSQIIKLIDNQGPILTCPPNLTVGTQFWYCYANVSVPKPQAHDVCSDVIDFNLSVNGGSIVQFGNNFVINGLLIGTYTAIWIVSDGCGNSSTCSFTITVVDDVAPVANCDQHTIVALTNDGPAGLTLVPATVFNDGSYDNCGPVTFRVRRMDSCIDFDWTTNGACVDDVPNGIVNGADKGTIRRTCVPFACCDVGAGPIMVELEVTDAAGNVNYCMVEASVQDKISPFVACPPDITVSCDFWFNVQEGTFVDNEGNGNGNLDEDPLSSIFGNMFDAFRYPESIRDLIVINDPGNNDFNQPHTWGIDGWADDNCEVNLQVRVRVFNDCSGDNLPPGAPAGAVKLIERRFSASDGNQGIAPGTCTQRIWVVNFHPFYITDQTCTNSNPNDGVIWPCDVLLTTCPDSITGTGEPTIIDNACSLIGIAYEDTRFEFVEEGACFKILREWSIIDWCQYNTLTGEGLWHYTQVIKVHDKEGPEFVNCPVGPVTLCVADDGVSLPANNQAFLGEDNPQSSSCSVHLNLCQTVHESCSDVVHYDVKLYLNNEDEFIYLQTLTTAPTDENDNAQLCFDTRQNASAAIRNNGIPYNNPFCGDYHKILWSAEDGCGNWSHCEYLIRLEDCKQPSPVCINGLSTVVMPIGGQVTIWAKDFNASSFDDCTPEAELLYSFSGDVYQPSFTYTCDNVPAFGVELSVNIWVADGGTDDNCNGQISWTERNKDFCQTTIVITDNANVCDTSGSILYEGQILTDHNEPVGGVNVSLNSNTETIYQMTTTANGQYALIVPQIDGRRYVVIPKRSDDARNGVSTLDLVRIQKHLLGIEPFVSPYQYIAADANNSQQVSAIDLLEIRKLILGIYSEYPNNDSWRFIDKGYIIPDPTNPWPFEETINLQYDGISHSGLDFMGVKIGDVNNTVKANALQILPRGSHRLLHVMEAGDSKAESGKVVNVSFIIPEVLQGFQWTLETKGLEYLGINSDDIAISNSNVGVLDDGVVTMSWNSESGKNSVDKKTITIVLQFMATQSGEVKDMIKLSGKVTEAEAYTFDNEILDVKLEYKPVPEQNEFALYQNEPNPWTGITSINFNLPEAGHVKLSLFDVTGKQIKVIEGEFASGSQSILLNKKDISTHGVLYYRLDSGNYSATKKMIRLE